MGTLAFMTVDPAKPPLMASKTTAGSTPAFLARMNASAQAAMFAATMIWFASLVVLPAPMVPQ